MKRPVQLAALLLCTLFTASLLAQATAASRPAGVPKDWILFTAKNAFSFWGPPDMKEQKVQGEDSYEGKYVSPTMEVRFDYGMYSGEYSGDKAKVEEITLDDRKATLATWDGGVELHVANVAKPGTLDANGKPRAGVKLSIGVTCKAADAPQATLLLRSLTFGTSTTRGGN